ncbi:uncharacterized protein LY89DRAFT_744243 [Mollisia scopiformis]|uniref:Heterokaryon incompatibility domain-containing protein n=1 Tax=Mollisia scopiformis TaxID=149040 RepID=A0A194XUR5_MOLSC|nr:uncharacterized protein LY89DRAFT_744243 [Mollisia scopiformis]KUJ23779.1 hypothetical protein LY89DRAFT_744243 [Mollisia scopiformis]
MSTSATRLSPEEKLIDGPDMLTLYLNSTIKLFQESQCLPLPDPLQLSDQEKLVTFLYLFYNVHAHARYCFQCDEMQSIDATAINQPIAPVIGSPELHFVFTELTLRLLNSSKPSRRAVHDIRPLASESMLFATFYALYSTFLRYPLHLRPVGSGNTTAGAREAVLGWSNYARSSLPLAETVVSLQARSGGFYNATTICLYRSFVLHALTVSPGQGQLEWLALVCDTFAVNMDSEENLVWYKIVSDHSSGALPGSQSLVINEIIMTEFTIERPNELFELLTQAFAAGPATDVTYAIRRRLALKRVDGQGVPRSSQPAAMARTMIRQIKKAIRTVDVDERKRVYEIWVRSEWDAPSILFTTDEIREILMHLDDPFIMKFTSDSVLRYLVVKSVDRELPAMDPAVNIPEEATRLYAKLEHLRSELLEVAIEMARVSSENPMKGQILDGLRLVGTSDTAVLQPSRLWDLVFNTTIESTYTTLPWIAVSHSWSQADGSCFTSINNRANIIPWATLADLNNIRDAMMATGLTMGWMDKICLRQRGTEGFDGALRQLEWTTDIPLIDVAYRHAAKILVYLDGAGREINYRTTFREKSSWLYRKWTAQETPSGVELVLGSGRKFLEGCESCVSVIKRLRSVQELRNLKSDAQELEKLRHVWEVMQGRSAGCPADHVLSLVSILGLSERPRYDSRYNLPQAVSLLKEHLPTTSRQILEQDECASWFDGMFSTFSSSSLVVPSCWGGDNRLAAFSIKPTATEDVNKLEFALRGILSRVKKVFLIREGDVSAVQDISSDQNETTCTCLRVNKPLYLDNRDIYADFFVWHGYEACCAAVVPNDRATTDGDLAALRNATHLLLGENQLICAPLKISDSDMENIEKYELLLSSADSVAILDSALTWTIVSKGQQSRTCIIKAK